MSLDANLKDECVRILSEIVPALSGAKLSPRADNLAFLASNVLAKLGAELANIARGSVEAEEWAKAVLATRPVESKETEREEWIPPHSCAPVPKERTASKRRQKVERKPKWYDVGDERIIAVLRESPHVTAAARSLGTTATSLYLYAQRRPAVWETYQATARLGLSRRGERGRKCGFHTRASAGCKP